MCGILLAVLLAALVAPPARADDPTPRCIARKLGAAGKLRAAGGRATATLRANARAFPGSTSPRPAHVRAKRLAAAIESARQRFDVAFTRLERRGECVTSGDGVAVGGAVDAALDVISAALNVVTRETVSLPSPVA